MRSEELGVSGLTPIIFGFALHYSVLLIPFLVFLLLFL